MINNSRIPSHRTTSSYVAAESRIVALEDIPIDESIPQGRLNIEQKTRSNLLPWRGQFSPELVDALLETYGVNAQTILDPFAGSGTVLVEAARKSIRAIGSELNPAAYHLARIYELCVMSGAERKAALRQFQADLTQDLVLYSAADPRVASNAVRAISAGLAGKSSIYQTLAGTFIVLLDLNLTPVTPDRVFLTLNRLRQLVLSLPQSPTQVSVFWSDARRLPIEESLVDLVITSPPYVNVFNYHQQYRRSAEALGYDLLDVARSEIGSNRKNRSNRFFTVVQYILDMTDVLKELARVCAPDARLIFVVGRESNVKKTRFFNSEILASIASLINIKVIARQERVFTNRFGRSIYEDLLHFHARATECVVDKHLIKHLAEQILINAVDRCPTESLKDLEAAIKFIETVESSPYFEQRNEN